MVKFYLSRFFQYFLVIFVTITLNFILPRAMPGDPLDFIIGEEMAQMTEEQINDVRERYGLNGTIFEQYIIYLDDLLHGDFGYSYRSKMPVTEIIADKLPWTLLLSSLNILISTGIGIVMGSIAAWNRGKWQDIAISNVFIFLKAMPSFWVGMVLITIFGSVLGWLPIFGAESVWARYEGFARVLDVVKHLILPLTTLVILSVSNIFITMRYSLVDILGEDYILMAQMKGLKGTVVKYRHAMRNALVPVVTVVMLNIGYMVGGATIIETVFSYPGMGRLLYESVAGRDYPVIQACFLIITLCVIAANIVADILYPILDPRVV